MKAVARLTDRIRVLLGRVPEISIDPSGVEHFTHPGIRDAMRRVPRTHYYSSADHRTIPGWLMPNERRALYALSRWLDGPIMEIGSWAGLSTVAIAEGIRDSGRRRAFWAVELNPGMENSRPVEGGVGFFVAGEDAPHGVCSQAMFDRDIRPVLEAPGGVVGQLRRNLRERGLEQLVTIEVGDFRLLRARTVKMLFCDALHDEAEISANAPAFARFLEPGSVLACHDVGSKPHHVELLRSIIPLGHGVTVGSLYCAEVAGQPSA
jgi:hypothetical protein